MLKVVVYAPKGGVGKTTIAVNVALLLAGQGHKVWAWDLSQRELMTTFLKESKEFSTGSTNRIHTEPLGELPTNFPGASSFDYLVADTDDYEKIYANLLEKNRIGWRVIVPIVPSDQSGLITIPQETGKLMVGAYFKGIEQRPKIFIVMNHYPKDQFAECHNRVVTALEKSGVGSLLVDSGIPTANFDCHPHFINDRVFYDALTTMLQEVI